MVKIDGTKIKQLREQQGLTQLYLATAVEVTTDTISRWENKRYPSIKMENGIKLADTLGVSLEELLDQEQENDQLPATNVKGPSTEVTATAPTPIISQPKKIWPIVLLSTTLLCVLLLFLYYFQKSQQSTELGAQRIVPQHAIAGQPFPVVIKINETGGVPTAVILNEIVPVGAQISQAFPETTGKKQPGNRIKWLGKVQSERIFSYIVHFPKYQELPLGFSGTVSFSGDQEENIQGQSEIILGTHHWADQDKDNIISDKEILAVYDNYSDVKGLGDEIDTIEEIWLGSGYKWDNKSQSYEILD